MVKNGFFWHNSKNIDILILRKEQNLFSSESYMCVPSLVKIDWEMPVKNPRWLPRNLVFLHLNIRPRWFPAHHRDRLVFIYFQYEIYSISKTGLPCLLLAILLIICTSVSRVIKNNLFWNNWKYKVKIKFDMNGYWKIY